MKLLSAQTQFKKQTMLHAISRIHAKYDIKVHFRTLCFVSLFKVVSLVYIQTSFSFITGHIHTQRDVF